MRIPAIAVAVAVTTAAPALAQRLPFERAFDVTGAQTIDVVTDRGKIEIVPGAPGRVVIAGAATVRVGWNVPTNALELTRKVAAAPPIEQHGSTFRLRTPTDDAEQRAMTISYRVEVPPETDVRSVSESGATSIRGIAGAVAVRTQSAAIDLSQLGGAVDVTTGSGAVTVGDIGGALTAKTGSSSLTGRSLRGDVHARTESGAIDLTLSGAGRVDVQTGSSAIRLRGVTGGLTATSRSGHVTVDGAPGSPWDVSTGSSGLDLTVDRRAALDVDASTESGSVKVVGSPVEGAVTKRSVKGTIGGGGALVRATSRSGSILVTVS